jgi:hypothetical protein
LFFLSASATLGSDDDDGDDDDDDDDDDDVHVLSVRIFVGGASDNICVFGPIESSEIFRHIDLQPGGLPPTVLKLSDAGSRIPRDEFAPPSSAAQDPRGPASGKRLLFSQLFLYVPSLSW